MPDIDILIKATDRASGPIKSVDNALDNLDKNAGNVAAKGIGQLRNALGVGIKVAAAAAVVAIGALSVALGASFKAAVDMEQAVADIMAVMGKAAPPVEELNQAIQGLGLDPKLKVSAFEAADAIEMLAKNGITWEQISTGMARSTILLANATNDDFALAATVATDAMVQFNKDASEMADVVDGIIGVTQQSKFDINDYALALGMAGGVAGSVGVEFEDFNAMLAATSSSFESGSDAGTSFKVFLQQLIPDTNKSADAMRKLGLFSGLTGEEFDKLQGKISDTQQKIADLDPTSATYSERLSELNAKLAEQRGELTKGGSAFFDANGSMKSAEEITAALSTAFTGLSDAERITAASTIFGADAMRTALALADAGEDTVHKFKLAIGDTSAEDAAATRMDTLRGAWEIFMGVTQTLSIQLGQVFLPVARDVVEWATQLASTHGPKVIAWFSGLTSSITTFVALLKSGQSPLTAFRDAFVGFIPPATMAAFDQIVDKTKAVIDWVGKTIGPFITWKDVLVGLAVVLGTVVVASIVSFLVAIAPVALVIGGVIAAVALLRNAWERDWGGIQGLTKAAMDSLTTHFGALGQTIKTFGADALKEIGAFVTGNETQFTALGKIWDDTKKTAQSLFTDMGNSAKTIGGPFLKWFDTQFPQASAALKKAFEDVSQRLGELWDVMKKAFSGGSDSINKILVQLQAWWKDHGDSVMKIVDNFLKVVITVISSAIQIMTNMLKLFFQIITGDWKGAWQTIKDTTDVFANLIKTILGTAIDNFKILWQVGLDTVVGTIRTKLSDAVTTVTGKAAEIVTGFVTGLANFVGSVTAKIMEIKNAITAPFADSGNWLLSAGQNVVQGFINGIGGMIGAAQTKVSELATLAAQAMGITLESDSPSKVFTRYGEDTGKGYLIGLENSFRSVESFFANGMGSLPLATNGMGGFVPPASSNTNSTSINNSRTTSNSMVVQVQSTGDAVRDIRNQVELYALTFGAT